MSEADIYFFEAFAEEQLRLESLLPAGIKACFTVHAIQEWPGSLPEARIYSTRTQSLFPLRKPAGLEAVLSRSTGFNHLINPQIPWLKDVALGYLPLYCSRAVAEQAMLLWMALLRKLSWQTSQFNSFLRDGLSGSEAAGKTLSIFGVGNIGHEVARIGKGLKMKVLGVDLVQKHRDINYADPQTALIQADILVAAMNLTEQNRGYFSSAFFGKHKDRLIFINIARGELSPPDVLYSLLDNWRLGGVGLDVFDHEAELAGYLRGTLPAVDETSRIYLEMARLPNVILTPHNAFNTIEAVQRKTEQTIRQTKSFLKSGQFIWVPEIRN